MGLEGPSRFAHWLFSRPWDTGEHSRTVLQVSTRPTLQWALLRCRVDQSSEARDARVIMSIFLLECANGA